MIKTWNCIFSVATNRGVACNRGHLAGEFARQIPSTECAEFDVYPDRYLWTGSGIEERLEWAAEQAAKAITEAKAKAEEDIRATGSAQLLALGKPYSAEERETWITQESEAREWVADSSAPCPMITAMATARGITVELMAQKIIENADLFKVMAGQILGAQQKAIDEVI